MPNVLTELLDPTSMTVFGVVVGLSFGLSIGITSFMAWLRPPRAATGRGIVGVRRQAAPTGPQQTWRMASLRPALRHVWRRQSEAITVALPIQAGGGLERMLDRMVPVVERGKRAGVSHFLAHQRIETTDYAIALLRRDLERMMPPAVLQQSYPAFRRFASTAAVDAEVDLAAWAA